MTSPDKHANTPHESLNSHEPGPRYAIQYQAGYTDSLNLMRMEAFLLRVVGRKGADALLLRSRKMCGRYASSAALSSDLLRLCADLLGEPMAQRMLQAESGHPSVFPAA
jgi:hypothetical protein